MPGVDSRFVFRGNAVGAAGRLVAHQGDKTVLQSIPSQAPSCLPVTGGLSAATTKKCRILSNVNPKSAFLVLGSATTRAESEPDGFDKMHTTVVKSEAEGIEIIGRIKIASVRVQMTSTARSGDPEPRIVPDVAEINGLTIDGCPLKITYEKGLFRKYATHKEFVEAYSSDGKLRAKAQPLLAGATEAQPKPDNCGWVVATVVRKVEWADPAKRVEGITFERNVVRWAGVGNIYLGELLISEHSRRLTMVRAEFGDNHETLRSLGAPKLQRSLLAAAASSDVGSLSIGEAESNGSTVP